MERTTGFKVHFVLLICLCSIAAILAGGASAGAFSEADLAKLKATNQCPNCDLAGANLKHAHLPDANLMGAYLSGADLQQADLSGADLQQADLSGASLDWATWTDGRVCKPVSSGTCN